MSPSPACTRALAAALALSVALCAAPQPPPLSTLAGIAVAPDSNSRDTPSVANFWGSVGTTHDVLGLSQVLLPPFLDVGLPTGTLGHARPSCTPDTVGAWTIDGTAQYFALVSANASLRVYNVSCTTACSTSWHTAVATMAVPFTAVHVAFHMQPGFKPATNDGEFDASCSVLSFGWCASTLNPSCAPVAPGIPLEGWRWTPTGVLRWGGPAASETRMLFEGYGVLQRVSVTPNASALAALQLTLTGGVRAYETMGWTTDQVGSLVGYDVSLTTVGAAGVPALLACDAVTSSRACAVWVVSAAAGAAFNVSLAFGTSAVLAFEPIELGQTLTLALALVVAADAPAALALAATLADAGAFAAAWDGFAAGWDARWRSAFTPDGGHFSGSLPVLALDGSATGDAIERQYYMGVFTLLLLERTNLPALFPRVYLTGTGNVNCGRMEVGGTQQWAWDQSFQGAITALLDPDAVRADLRLWMNASTLPNGISLDSLKETGGFYAFNAIALFRTYSTFLRITGASPTDARLPADSFLDFLADSFLRYCLPGSTLADYSASPGVYLECVPTYIHATAATQGGNAYMARDLADLRDAQGNATRAAALRARAAAIATETLASLYIAATSGARGGNAPGDVGGWWRVLDTKDPSGSGTREVRHVVDLAYATLGLCSPRWPDACALNASVAAQMADFALRQLRIPSGAWLRALAPLDGAAPVARPDHGSTGSYSAWPAMAFDALSTLAGFDVALAFLAGIAHGADEGPYGQAQGIADDKATVFKTTGGCNRYIANNGAAFAESVLHVIFGYEPLYLATADPSPARAAVPRGNLSGTLACIRGPALGGSGGAAPRYATATLDASGVSYVWAASC